MGKRILVADDSLTIQRAFAMVLAGTEYSPVAARSAEQALSAAKAGRPDLVLVDAVLGNSSGYDLCAALKAEPALRAIPVHMLASSQNPYDEARGRRCGADGHMLKPFDSQGLVDGLAAALVAPVVAAAARPEPSSRITEEAPAAEDSYGEFTIERSSAAPGPQGWSSRPPSRPSGARPLLPAQPSVAAVARPSLIPGARPALAVPIARPGVPSPSSFATPLVPTIPRPLGGRAGMGFPPVGSGAMPGAPAGPAAPRPGAVPRPAAPGASAGFPFAVPAARSPAAAPYGPPAWAPALRRPSAPMPAVPEPTAPRRPSSPMPAVPEPVAPRRPSSPMPAVAAAISSAVDGKIAALAARGPEYEAIAKLSREIIEQVVWEVVPELAEVIIRQEVDRLAAAKR